MSSKGASGNDRDLEKEIQDLFHTIDKDHSGTISSNELGRVMRCIRRDVTSKEVDQAMAVLDRDGNGTIEYKEFLHFMKKAVADHDEIKAAFDTFDRDHNGYIDFKELKLAMQNWGDRKFTEKQLSNMFNKADVNHDGKIDFEEFKKMWKENMS